MPARSIAVFARSSAPASRSLRKLTLRRTLTAKTNKTLLPLLLNY